MNTVFGCQPVEIYVNRVNRLRNEFAEKTNANAIKIAKRIAKGNTYTYDIKNLVFAAIPMEVCVKNFGYEFKTRYDSIDKNFYSVWVNDSLFHGKISVEELAAAWQAYDVEVAKSKWFNYATYIKNFDFEKAWDKHYVDSVNVCDRLIENPIAIIYHQLYESRFRRSFLSTDEFDEIANFFNQPENKAVAVSKLKALRKKVEACRPTVTSACDLYMKEMFCDSYGENDIKWNTSYGNRSLWAPKETEERRWYGNQSNEANGDCARSFARIIVDTIKTYFPDKRDLLAAFQSGLTVTVNDEGNHKSSDGPVVSSSFWTYYTNDFSVELSVYKSDKKFVRHFKDVTVHSSYFSGGW